MSPIARIGVALASVLASSALLAASFTIQEITRQRGQEAAILVSVTGDGRTSEAQLNLVFDEARLSLPQSAGTLTGAGSNGALCSRTSSNSVVVLTGSVTGAPLPNRATVLCILPFRVFDNAPRGKANVMSASRFCGNAQGGSEPCTSTGGGVFVDAPAPPAPAASPGSKTVLITVIPNGPSTIALTSGNFAAGQPWPIAALNAVRPINVRRLVPERKGDALRYIINNPNTGEAKLDRVLAVNYESAEIAQAGLTALRSDPLVATANINEPTRFAVDPAGASAPVPPSFLGPIGFSQGVSKNAASDSDQYHRNALNIPEAWTYAGGWGLVIASDTGIAENHPGLRAFETNFLNQKVYVGGNYLSALSGNEVSPQFGPDERSPQVAPDILCDNSDGVPDGLMRSPIVGHGTHIAGLVSANPLDSDGIEGTCKNCGFAVRKILNINCAQGALFPLPDAAKNTNARLNSLSFGAQVFTVSFGFALNDPDDETCDNPQKVDPCAPIQAQVARDVLLPAAAGNARAQIIFPAEDRRIPAIAGSNEINDVWDDSPGSIINCADVSECGSNFRPVTAPPVDSNDRGEVSAPAKNVRSTIYPGFNWSSVSACGDVFGSGPNNDGIGLCTGTSMSTPMIAGIYGLLRSINPLVPAGSLDNGVAVSGIRTLVASTASLGNNRDLKLGFGLPNAAAAARGILGQVRGVTAKNRAIPLFGFYSVGHTDYAVTANPQLATALQVDQTSAYSTLASAGMIEGTAVPGYSAFPGVNIPQPPRARAFVLSTEFSPVPGAPLTPLFLLERCRTVTDSCAVGSRDMMVITGENDLTFAVNAGFDFLGLQGYIYARCSNEPACMPVGTQKLYLQCNTVEQDCAVFLEAQRLAFEAAGYSAAFKGGSEVLGYAYTAGNSDSDLLPDAVEYVAGLNPFSANSDGEGANDDVEYPLAALPVSDPCTPGNIFCGQGDQLFKNGFE